MIFALNITRTATFGSFPINIRRNVFLQSLPRSTILFICICIQIHTHPHITYGCLYISTLLELL